jgi:predicted AlkP superfamily phosphohydrolase/phosphomutase
MGVRRNDWSDAVTPASLTHELMAPFSLEVPVDTELQHALLAGPAVRRPDDAHVDPMEALRTGPEIDRRTLDVSEWILGYRPDLSVLAVYLDGFDQLSHSFWQYRFPGDFHDDKPSPADVTRLGPVLDRYAQVLDRRIGRLIDQFPRPPNVVIVSDHGHGPTTIISRVRGWHAPEGIFVMAGPDVSPRAAPMDVSYYDVVPTLLRLQGFKTPSILTGRVRGVEGASRGL